MSKVATNNAAKFDKRRRPPGSVTRPARPRTVTPSGQVDRTPKRRSGSVIPLDRVSMLVMEANEISQCLGKNYHFIKNVEVPGDEEQTTIQVINRNLSMSCLWSLTKLKEKLVLMRKLVYAGDSASSGLCSEAVFYDPRDDWKKEPISAMYFDMSPDGATGNTDAIDAAVTDLQQRQINNTKAPDMSRASSARSFPSLSTGSSTSGELPAESKFIPTSSQTGPAKHTENVLPQRYLMTSQQDEQLTNHMPSHTSSENSCNTPVISTSSHGYGVPSHPKKLQLTPRKREVDISVQTDNLLPDNHVSLLTLCREMVTMTTARLKRQAEKQDNKESIVDRILASCESVKVAVVNILEVFSQSQCDSQMTFADSDLVRVMSMQIVAALEVVVSLTDVWLSLFDSLTSLAVIKQSIQETVRDLAMEILVFLQACESGTLDEAHISSSQIISQLYQLLKLCGQLSLATDGCPASLSDEAADDMEETGSATINKDNDLVHMEPSSDLKQSFLQGADTYLDDTLESCLQAIECSETQAEALAPDDKGACKSEANNEVLKHVYIVVATSKLLVLKVQQIQVELDTELGDDHPTIIEYYLLFYKRCQSLLVHITRLSDNISLLVQAAQPLAAEVDPEPGILMKVCRCSELIQRNAHRLLTVPYLDENTHNPDISIDQSVTSNRSCDMTDILSTKQISELQGSRDDVDLATKALIDLCQRELEPFKGRSLRTRRMLPVTPSGVRHSVPRCRSARSAETRYLNRNMSEADNSSHQ